MLATVPMAMVPKRRRETLKRRLSVLLAAVMLGMTVVVAGPVLAQDDNGNHYGLIKGDNGKHIGAGDGGGKEYNSGRRGLR
jgi:hypothetical protein